MTTKTTKVKAVKGGVRAAKMMILTEEQVAWLAKNRWEHKADECGDSMFERRENGVTYTVFRERLDSEWIAGYVVGRCAYRIAKSHALKDAFRWATRRADGSRAYEMRTAH